MMANLQNTKCIDRISLLNRRQGRNVILTLTLFAALAMAQAVSLAQALPPISERILSKIEGIKHPFILAEYDEFRKARQIMRDEPFYDRGKEFVRRVEGYAVDTSPWYLGEGPLSANPNFYPDLLGQENLQVYTQVLCETVTYTSFEQERWAINRVEMELRRLLDTLEPQSTLSSTGLPQTQFTATQSVLLALAAFAYDTIYHRIDTVDRHEFNERFKRIRDHAAAFCSTLDAKRLPPYEKTVLGTGLGLSTLFCVSIYPLEWGKKKQFSVQLFLPDLYRAVTLSTDGMKELVSPERRFESSLPQLDTALLIAIPWFERLKSLGYAFVQPNGLYQDIVATLETYRLPGTTKMIVPNVTFPPPNPWIPNTALLFWGIDPRMFKKERSLPAEFVTFPQPDIKGVKLETIGLPDSLRAKEVTKKIGRPITLKEQLEILSLPRKERPFQKSEESLNENPNAGWAKPAGLLLPPIWGALYMLAARESLSSNLHELWTKMALDVDSHPYTFIYWRLFAPRRSRGDVEPVLVQNPDRHFTLFSYPSSRENYLISTQSATATVLIASYAIDHESFLLSDNCTEWKWHHEIPAVGRSASRAIDATSTLLATFDDDAPDPVVQKVSHERSAAPLFTSMYSCWPTYSPSGETLLVRRHLSGVGSGFTLVAHFPDPKTSRAKTKYVNFRLTEDSDSISLEDIPGMFQILPAAAKETQDPMTMREFRIMKKAERDGMIDLSDVAMLNILFSPDSLRRSSVSSGVLGKFVEMELEYPDQPFFYVLTLDMAGRELFDVKYSLIPLPGMRVLEWRQGTEIIAINMGDVIKNDFIESDADLVIVTRDNAMKGIFYLLVNGTYLRAKFSPTQRDFTLLADTKGKRVTAAWANQRIHTSRPPNPMSVFYAPNIVAFVCPDAVIKYGKKNRQAVVWGHE
ncbi:MAG: hypothetical protein C4527_04430 [Candidatus Omnitrophota bacterium]|jgi:hypothetical protein|nr:MAG: hypothetical protein C4527_04430 [Candidatus Omnitrophota bacterium]